MNIAVLLLSVSLFVAPLLAALPEKPMWPSLLNVFVLVSGVLLLLDNQREKARAGDAPRGRRAGRPSGVAVDTDTPAAGPMPISKSTVSLFLVALVGWGLVSVLIHAATGKLAFLWDMLRNWTSLLGYAAAFFSLRHLFKVNVRGAYAVGLAAIAGGTLEAVLGAREYLVNFVAGNPAWRIFGTTENPDFLAAYLVILAPVTFAAALVAPKDNRGRWLLFFAAALQTIAIFPTGSRFALISIVVSFLVFGGLALRMRANAEKPAKLSPAAIAGIVALVVVVGLISTPVISRLTSGRNGNSGQFRVYTWRGTTAMAKANPVFGTGPGTFADVYPEYAVAGFTRHAHDTYLQFAAEMGAPAAILLVVIVCAVIVCVLKYIFESTDPTDTSARLSRLFAAGLLAGIVAESVQNLIDSDLYVYAIGLTFWAVTGAAVGVSERAPDSTEASAKPISAPVRWAAALVLVVSAAFCGMNSAAAHYADSAQTILGDPNGSAAEAAADYRSAESLAPLNGKYPAELGYRVLILREGDVQGGIAEIRKGVERQPDSQNYLRLGMALQHAGDMAGGASAYLQGLKNDPNRLELLLALARTSAVSDALRYDKRIAEIEQSPVGQVRAIGEVTEQRYAIGDCAVADDALAHGDKSIAASYYRRAVSLLEHYADEGGSSFPERLAENGGIPNPQDDQQFAALYDHAMSGLSSALGGLIASQNAPEKQYYDAKFQSAAGDAFAALGRASDAKTAYQNAEAGLSGCAYPQAAALKSTLDSKLQSLSQ